jgi:hypothetical protein
LLRFDPAAKKIRPYTRHWMLTLLLLNLSLGFQFTVLAAAR